MASFSIFNSLGEYVGEAYSNDGGGSPSLIVRLIHTAVTSAVLIFVTFTGQTGFFKGVNSGNISSSFPALAASFGVIVVAFLISNAYNLSLLLAALKAIVFVIPYSLEAVSGLKATPALGFLLTAVSWLFTAIFVVLGAVPAFLFRILTPASFIEAFFSGMETMPLTALVAIVTGVFFIELYRFTH